MGSWSEGGTWSVDGNTITFEMGTDNYDEIGPSEKMEIDYEKMKMESDTKSYYKLEESE